MKQLSAALVFYVLTAGITLASSMTFVALSIYYVTVVGLNPLQLVLVGTAVEATILLFELPTGVVADTYSRRLSVIIGMFVLSSAWLLEGSVPLFAAIIVAEIIRGIGETFLSGALDAWLADEVGEANVGALYIRSGQINRVVGLVATAIGVGLGSLALNWPVLLGGVIYLALGIFLVLTMPETSFQPAPRTSRSPWPSMAATLRDGSRAVRGRPLLMGLLLASALWGAASEGYDRLWEAHLLTNFTFPVVGELQPIAWFGILSVISTLISLGVVGVLRSRLEQLSRRSALAGRALVVLTVLSMSLVFALALAQGYWAAFGILVARSVILSLTFPLLQTWLVQNIPSQVRATVLSMNGLMNAFGQTVGGPGVGALGNVRGIRAALIAAGLLILPEIGVFAWGARREARSEQAAMALVSEEVVEATM